jgi:hypothetical protein
MMERREGDCDDTSFKATGIETVELRVKKKGGGVLAASLVHWVG